MLHVALVDTISKGECGSCNHIVVARLILIAHLFNKGFFFYNSILSHKLFVQCACMCHKRYTSLCAGKPAVCMQRARKYCFKFIDIVSVTITDTYTD